MLKLRTGVPGHGKTLRTIQEVQEFRTNQKDQHGNPLPDRPVYYHGIKDLTLDWIYFDDPEKWYELPENCIIVIDEAQGPFPVRTKDKVPEKCSRFETHRHSGWDVFLVTQSPNFLDVHIRRLVGDHVHIERKFGMEKATLYASEKTFDPDNFFSRESTNKKPWSYPRELFGVYKSATQHTVKRKLPKWLLLIPVIILVLSGSIYAFTSAMSGVGSPIESDPLPSVSDIQSSFIPQQSSKTKLTFIQEHQPEILNVPQSAPFYRDVYKAKTFPRPQCITNEARDKCYCHSQQGTRMKVTRDYCLYVVDNGIFDPTITDKNDDDRRRRGGD